MHWGWAAGYRFVVYEGKAGASMSQTFEIHALGNQNYNNCQLPVEAKDTNGTLEITLNANYAMALKGINVDGGVITHGDYNEAVTLLQNFANYVFSNEDGETNVLSTPEYLYNDFLEIYPNPSKANVNVRFNQELNNKLAVTVHDLSGRQLLSQTLANNTTSFYLESGVYLIRLNDGKNPIALKRIIIQ